MTLIAPPLSTFLQQRLPVERGASENTCDSYAYSFQLLFLYAAHRFKIEPSALLFEQLDAPLVVDFLNHLEIDRGNSPVSRNIRLAAIKSFMRYMQYRLPAALEQIQQVLAIPYQQKRRTGDSSITSASKRCRPFLILLILQPDSVYVTEPCYSSASLQD